jgi:hypothetical protein
MCWIGIDTIGATRGTMRAMRRIIPGDAWTRFGTTPSAKAKPRA